MIETSNVVLIGMPGSGKSTVGRRLATLRGLGFIDTDGLIENIENSTIQQIVNRRGLRYLRAVEADVINSIQVENHVIATGGSAVYSARSVDYLGQIGVRVYLQISLATLVKRVTNSSTRGLVKMPQHSLPRLYRERLALYERAADVVFANDWPMSATRFDALNTALKMQF